MVFILNLISKAHQLGGKKLIRRRIYEEDRKGNYKRNGQDRGS